MPGLASALLLSDGRFPSGGHAHSGGLEASAAAGRVTTMEDLGGYLRGRLATVGLVTAALAAAANARSGTPSVSLWLELDAEADARTPSAVLRLASRRQGRQLLRAARRAWPGPLLEGLASAPPDGPHHAVALGAASAAAGLSSAAAATTAAYGSMAGPATAAVRLLSFDPLAVGHVLATLSPEVDAVAEHAAAAALGPLRDLPACGAPFLDLGAEAHATWEVRLFAS